MYRPNITETRHDHTPKPCYPRWALRLKRMERRAERLLAAAPSQSLASGAVELPEPETLKAAIFSAACSAVIMMMDWVLPVRVDGGVDDEEVVGAVDAGVEVDDGGAVGGAAVVDAHAGAADPVVAADHLGADDVVRGGAGGDVAEGGVGAGGEVEPELDKVGHGLAVLGVDEPGLGVEDGVAGGGDAELAEGRGAVGQERADGDDAAGHGARRALEVARAAVGALGAGPEVHALGGLGDGAGALLVEVEVGGDGARGDGVEAVGGEVGLGVELQHHLGVVLEVVADGEVDPVGLVRERDAGGRGAGLDDLEGVGAADARVPEEARRRHGAGGEHDLAALVDLDDLPAAVGGLDEDAGDLAAGADDLDDLGLELEGEVGQLLGEGHVGAGGAGAEVVLDGPRGAREDGVLLVGGLDRVDLGPALAGQEAGQRPVGEVVVVLAVVRGLRGARVALVQARGGVGDVGPAPARGPALPVVLGRVDEVEAVDRAGAPEQAAGGRGRVAAERGAGQAGHGAAEGGDVVGGEGVVPGEGHLGAEGHRVGRAALDEEDAGALLGDALGGDDAGGATADDDDIVRRVGDDGGRDGAVATRDRSGGAVAVTGAGDGSRGSLDGLGVLGPRLELGRLGAGDVEAELAEAGRVVVEGGGRVRGGRGARVGEGPAQDRGLAGQARLVVDAVLAEEGVGEVGGVDKGAVGDGHGADLGVGVDVRVGVGAAEAEAGADGLAVGPGDEEQAVQHASPEGDGAPVALVRDGHDHLADEVGADGLGHGDTEAVGVGVGLVPLEVDAGLRVRVSRGPELCGGRPGEPEEGCRSGGE
ncbi:hypothetical protein ColKHC_12312 [Colletotrichum higginsianum]|nr:hypothetical protein ColKHC_12312 [Colletotrichum higginsianum]